MFGCVEKLGTVDFVESVGFELDIRAFLYYPSAQTPITFWVNKERR